MAMAESRESNLPLSFFPVVRPKTLPMPTERKLNPPTNRPTSRGERPLMPTPKAAARQLRARATPSMRLSPGRAWRGVPACIIFSSAGAPLAGRRERTPKRMRSDPPKMAGRRPSPARSEEREQQTRAAAPGAEGNKQVVQPGNMAAPQPQCRADQQVIEVCGYPDEQNRENIQIATPPSPSSYERERKRGSRKTFTLQGSLLEYRKTKENARFWLLGLGCG